MSHALWLCGHVAVSQNTLVHVRCLHKPVMGDDFINHFPIGAAVKSAGLTKLLDACVAVTGAEAALLMDPHGLIITSRGPRQGDELEVVGARLMVAFEQADRIDGQRSTLSMAFELPRGTVQGLRLIQPDGVLTLGLIVPGGLSAERQSRLVSLIAAAE
jgi:hypothetical protein